MPLNLQFFFGENLLKIYIRVTQIEHSEAMTGEVWTIVNMYYPQAKGYFRISSHRKTQRIKKTQRSRKTDGKVDLTFSKLNNLLNFETSSLTF